MAFSYVEWFILAVVVLIAALLVFRGFATLLGLVFAGTVSAACAYFARPCLAQLPVPVDATILAAASGLVLFLLIRKIAVKLAWVVLVGGVGVGAYMLWTQYGGLVSP